MDDLKVLRDFGRGLEHEPPATLARQRRRLLDAATATASADAGAAAGPGRRRRFPGAGRPRRRIGWAALAGVAAVTAALVVVPTVLLRGTTPAGSTVAAPTWHRPAKQDGVLNVLVVGSDERPAPKGAPGLSLGERSDVMILVTVPEDGRKISAVSLPRDSMVRIPACQSPDGTTAPARTDMINSAFTTGGLRCAWKTVESLTGVRVDHAVEIRFSGFKDIVDALGGVEITLPMAVKDPKSKLDLPAGRHLLNGEQALAYVRTRYALGAGSDIPRIRRQQVLMASLLDKILHIGEPDRLRLLFQAVRKSVITDVDLDLGTLLTVLQGAQPGSTDPVRFLIVPVRPYPADPHRLEWLQPDAGRLFAQLRGGG
ncbi:LCP family protein [Sphaerisporangium dianthi]|uniref:LCP family protein n=1 Tax=Sphaerisporangium dianthi TaxID=1436120 RepID=A0ABV9CLT5_9ACTN